MSRLLANAARKNWTYGPQEGLATSTTAEDRALTIRPGATLRLVAGEHCVSFADPIVGRGTLAFADGAKFGLAGALREGAKTQWATIATVGAVTGTPVSSGYKLQTVANGDGTVSLQAKLLVGMTVIVR